MTISSKTNHYTKGQLEDLRLQLGTPHAGRFFNAFRIIQEMPDRFPGWDPEFTVYMIEKVIEGYDPFKGVPSEVPA